MQKNFLGSLKTLFWSEDGRPFFIHDFCWNAHAERIVWYVFSDDGTGGGRNIITDADSRHDNDMPGKPDIFSNPGGFIFGWVPVKIRLPIAVTPYHAMATNSCAGAN